MKHPQTLAETLYKFFPTTMLKSIKENACCAFALIWWLDIDCDDIDAIIMVADLIKRKDLDPDCTVYWAKCIKTLSGRELESLEKVPITDIKKIKGRAIVRYTRGADEHWVGVEDGKIVFNSQEYSRCVEEGKPEQMRVIKLKGVENY